MRFRWFALQWGVSRLFDLAALVIYADPRPPSRLALRRRAARAMGLPLPPRRDG